MSWLAPMAFRATCWCNLSFLQNRFWLHLCANPIWIFYKALEWKFNMRFIKHNLRLTFSCNFNSCQHSLFKKIQFLMWPKSQFFRGLHTTRIHRYFCFLHLLCSNIFSFTKDLASNHPVCREIARDWCGSNFEFSEYQRSLGLVERTCYFIL